MHKMFLEFEGNLYSLREPVSCSRPVEFNKDQIRMSQAFHLPNIEVRPVEIGNFIGDISRGGSCNVRIISFSPHNLTHIETPNHVSNKGMTLFDYNAKHFQGVAYMLDLSNKTENIENINLDDFHDSFQGIPKSIDFLAIKTHYSLNAWDENFSDKDPLYLQPNIIDYLNTHYNSLRGLFVDLPSLDREKDGGKLIVHKKFFQLDKNKALHVTTSKFIVELAHFENIKEGLYFTVLTPAKLQLDAIITDIFMYEMQSEDIGN